MTVAQKMIKLTQELSKDINKLSFSKPVTHIYNPLEYTWKAHSKYLKTYANSKKEIVFLGMNPGPWGMVQTGVPFGEVSYVRDWLKIKTKIDKPKKEHPKRPIEGFDCKRSEISGQRLWGFLKEEFKTPTKFFKNHFILNYCPLVFMEETGRNRTPDKLPKSESTPLNQICDHYLKKMVNTLEPKVIVGIGAYTQKKAKSLFKECDIKIGTILHPSPASPLANRGWAKVARKQLLELNIL